MSCDPGRSYEPITDADLARLAEIADSDRRRFLHRRPEYRHRLLCVALCQGAGLHYVDVVNRKQEPNGVKDFDVWSFFAAILDQRFPADRRMTHVDLQSSKFGKWPDEPAANGHYRGRRVDLLMRALPCTPLVETDITATLRTYLREGRTTSARKLAAKGVVLIEPAGRRGEIVWPEQGQRAALSSSAPNEHRRDKANYR